MISPVIRDCSLITPVLYKIIVSLHRLVLETTACSARGGICRYRPCGHGGICEACARQILRTTATCHFCREPVEDVARIERAGFDNDADPVAVATVVASS